MKLAGFLPVVEGLIYSQTNLTGPSGEMNWTTDLVSRVRASGKGDPEQSQSYAAEYHQFLCDYCGEKVESGIDSPSCAHGARVRIY